jgi:hypothetical protein
MRSIFVAVVLLACAVIAEPQQAKRLYRVGYLSNSSPSAESIDSEAISRRLRELEYVEGQTFRSTTDTTRAAANEALNWRFS